eukprot:7767173-Ditylum_brightwellii.AAC.2
MQTLEEVDCMKRQVKTNENNPMSSSLNLLLLILHHSLNRLMICMPINSSNSSSDTTNRTK